MSSKNPSVKSCEAEDSSPETGSSNWYGLTSMSKLKNSKTGANRQKMETRARQTEDKTQEEVIASFGKVPNNYCFTEPLVVRVHRNPLKR